MDFHAIDEGDGLFGANYPEGTAPTGFARFGFDIVADPRLGRNLSFWNGSGEVDFGPATGGEIVDLYKASPFGAPVDIVTMNGENSDVPGFELTPSLHPGYHEHTVAAVWGSEVRAPDDQPSPGLYLYTLRLTLQDEVFPLPNGFVEIIPGEQTSPVFHVMLITPGLEDDSVYEYGDIIYQFQYDEFGELIYDDAGNPLLLLDEFGNPIPELDDEGNPLRELIVHSPRFDAAVSWVHNNLGPAVPEPSGFALGAVALAAVVGFRLRSRWTRTVRK